MSRELGEYQDLSPGDFCYFPLGRGVLWQVVWVAPTNRDVQVYLDNMAGRRQIYTRGYGFEIERVVLPD